MSEYGSPSSINGPHSTARKMITKYYLTLAVKKVYSYAAKIIVLRETHRRVHVENVAFVLENFAPIGQPDQIPDK